MDHLDRINLLLVRTKGTVHLLEVLRTGECIRRAEAGGSAEFEGESLDVLRARREIQKATYLRYCEVHKLDAYPII